MAFPESNKANKMAQAYQQMQSFLKSERILEASETNVREMRLAARKGL